MKLLLLLLATVQAVDIAFDDKVYNVCEGDVATVTWNGYHNIQEVTASGYDSYSTAENINTELHPFENSGTVLNVNGLESNPDQTRYFVCALHPASKFRTTCSQATSICNECSCVDANGHANVDSLANGAFRNCAALQSVTILDGVQTIAEFAFAESTSLSSVTLSNSNVTKVDNGGFLDCSSLTSISFPSNFQYLEAYSFKNTGITSLVLPNSMRTIGNDCFQYSSLASITLPNNRLTTIGSSAFEGTPLTSIVIPNTVSEVGYNVLLKVVPALLR